MSYLKFCEPPDKLEDRIKIAKENQGHLEPNCYGTSFFLLGVLPYDMVIFTGKKLIRKAISRMEKHTSPRDNSLMITNIDGGIVHSAFIEKSSPMKGYQREGAEGPFSEINSFLDVERYISSVPMHRRNGIIITHDFYTLGKDDLKDWAKDIVEQYHLGWYA